MVKNAKVPPFSYLSNVEANGPIREELQTDKRSLNLLYKELWCLIRLISKSDSLIKRHLLRF